MVKMNGGQMRAVVDLLEEIGGGTNVVLSQAMGGRNVRFVATRNVGGPSQTFGPYIVKGNGVVDRSPT